MELSVLTEGRASVSDSTDTKDIMACTDIYYNTLETLGIVKNLSETKVKIYSNIGEFVTLNYRRKTREDVDIVIPGSRGEGTALSFDNDVDVLVIYRSVRCTESYQRSFGNALYLCPVIIQLDCENVPCGYAKLRIISVENYKATLGNQDFVTNVKTGIIERNGFEYLRNDQTFGGPLYNNREGLLKQENVFADTAGPARQFTFELPLLDKCNLSLDLVQAFPCTYPSVVDAWCNRTRIYDWPHKDVIETIRGLDVLVVPAGVKGCDDEILQWRISLTLAEQKLVHSFTDSQIKLFCVMIMLAKRELKPICDNIGSYIVKNVIFWVIEKTVPGLFRKEYFLDRLLQILEYLKVSVLWRYLPSYMIPSKNLLESKTSEKEKEELVNKIDAMIGEGLNVLLRCPLVKERLELSQSEFQKRLLFRTLTEQVILSTFCIPQREYERMLTRGKDYIFLYGEEDIIYLLLFHIFPNIRRYNPFGFFNLLISIPDREVFICLREGVKNGYHKS